jgi:hypothetical protein
MSTGDNLTSNPVTDCCLTIKSRSPLAKRAGTLGTAPTEGGNRKWLKVPQQSGGWEGDLDSGKNEIYSGFQF